MIQIRLTEQKDTASILAIYEPFIKETPVSFEEIVPSVEDFWERIREVLKENPWLVCEIDGQIAGYAYATEHRKRVAYRWTKEVSVYVHPDFQRKGIANGLYTSLVELLKFQGVTNVLAGITLPNEKSVKFHENFGFAKIGVYTGIGYKMNRWHDVGWWEMKIGDLNREPLSTLKNTIEIHRTREWNDAMEKGLEMIRI